MKDNWLYLGLVIITIGLVNNFVFRIILVIVWLVFLKFVLGKKKILKIGIGLILFLLFSIPNNFNITKGRVKEIKNGYYVVGNLLSNVIVYTDIELGLDDWVCFEGEVSDISSSSNFERYNYEDYCRAYKIIGSIDTNEIIIVRKGVSIRKFLYEHNKKYENNWINQLLFSTKLDTDSNLKYLVVSSGMHLSALFMLIKNLLRRKFYEEKATKITLLITIIFGIIFRFPYGCIRSVLSLILSLKIKNQRDRTGVYIYLLALYKPYYCYSVAFLLPCLNRIMMCFTHEYLWIKRIMLVMIVQLYSSGYCEIISCLLFGILRYLFMLLYVCGLFCSLLPFHVPFSLETLLETIEFKGVYLTNQIGIIFFIISFILLTINNKKNILLVLFLLVLNNYRNYLNPFYTITYLDVGQGDCAIISVPFSKKALLIDTGGSNYSNVGQKIVLPYLLRNGFDCIEVIITHYDIDHCGSLDYLKENIKVENVFDTKEDICFKKLDILSLNNEEYEDENDNSLVNYFKINDFGFLFLGDVSKEIEKKVVNKYLNLDVDICKIAHHGSNSATSDILLSTYKIKYAIISAGKNNVYHHPHYEVVERLNNYMVPYLTTQNEGAIKFVIYKNWLVFLSSKGTIGL